MALSVGYWEVLQNFTNKIAALFFQLELSLWVLEMTSPGVLAGWVFVISTQIFAWSDHRLFQWTLVFGLIREVHFLLPGNTPLKDLSTELPLAKFVLWIGGNSNSFNGIASWIVKGVFELFQTCYSHGAVGMFRCPCLLEKKSNHHILWSRLHKKVIWMSLLFM